MYVKRNHTKFIKYIINKKKEQRKLDKQIISQKELVNNATMSSTNKVLLCSRNN